MSSREPSTSTSGTRSRTGRRSCSRGAPRLAERPRCGVGRRGLRRHGRVRRPDRDADHAPHRRTRPALHELSHHGPVLADAFEPAQRAATRPATTWRASPRRRRDSPGSRRRIPFENGMIAEVLNERGWNTYAVGKWHLTPGDEIDAVVLAGTLAAWPRLRALLRVPGRRDQPVVSGPGLRQPPDRSARLAPRTATTCPRTSPTRPSEFIRDAKAVAPDKPWFMYFCPGAAHAPHHVFKEWADRYQGRFDQGYEAIRAEILAEQKELGAPARGRRALADQPAW